MKKIFMGSAALTTFAISMLVFQMSCKEDAIAQPSSDYTLPTATTSTLGGIIVGDGLDISGDGTLSIKSKKNERLNLVLYSKDIASGNELWLCNIDGSDNHKIPIFLPEGYKITNGARLTPDGAKIVFGVTSSSDMYIYTCDVNGSNLTKIVDDGPTSQYYSLEDVY
ncbi:hypothetical protein I2I11_05040 [Pontibacter sp. 172403-2]|uniref:hypothetical protein n=1 Tax=Pontibacter rufus TaxID=2791028 RepID=UPI0018AFF0C0|nr:hypothetical protein [Pontibacter sp. 172403-2]MBF9252649.1 hypothetical protein [Pontibacter sp. 172403-2]